MGRQEWQDHVVKRSVGEGEIFAHFMMKQGDSGDRGESGDPGESGLPVRDILT